jgi:tetratricopeptide (TPR) repeat protein
MPAPRTDSSAPGFLAMFTRRVLVPALALCLWAAGLPVSPSRGVNAASDEECLTLADAPPAPRPDLVATLERCSALYPADVELLADLGAQYEAGGRRPEAEAVYRRALAVDPAYAELRLRLGRLLLARGAAALARREAQAALDVQPNRQAALDLLRDAQGAPENE